MDAWPRASKSARRKRAPQEPQQWPRGVFPSSVQAPQLQARALERRAPEKTLLLLASGTIAGPCDALHLWVDRDKNGQRKSRWEVRCETRSGATNRRSTERFAYAPRRRLRGRPDHCCCRSLEPGRRVRSRALVL